MDVNQIPQDKSKTYGGHAKIIYATTEGKYTSATSDGWQDEEYATLQAVNALTEQTQHAYDLVKSGQKSPLFYYMFAYRHDVTSLAQTSGFFRWQIRRHLNLKIFNQLSDKKLMRYAQAFNLSIEQLRQLPDQITSNGINDSFDEH